MNGIQGQLNKKMESFSVDFGSYIFIASACF